MNKKILKSVLGSLLILCTFLNGVPVTAATTYGSPEGTYIHVCNKTSKDSKGTNTYYHQLSATKENGDHFYSNKKLCSCVKHIKGSRKQTLSVTQSQSYTSEKTTNWSVNSTISSSFGTGVASPFKCTVEVSASVGYGETYSESFSYGTSCTVSFDIGINDATGYYTIAPGQTYYKMKDIEVNTRNGATNIICYEMPYGDSCIYLLYSSDNKNYYPV